jgi:aryl-alcohol dehydrogenase-like predicted oxidoreductase
MRIRRRRFLQGATAAAAVAGVVSADSALPVPRRIFKPGVELSTIGFGGIVVCGQEQKEADRWVAESFDRGVNYYDVAPTYFDGEAEIKLGQALRPYRDRAFLACKTTKRYAAGAREELERSLQRLHTDYFDLYQFHAVSTMEDVEKILAPDGAAKLFLQARKEGKVRFLGFSAHHAGAAIALMERMPLDSILFPVNYVCYAQGGFGPQILAKAKEKGLARLALKALARTRWPAGTERAKTGYPKCWYQPEDDLDAARLAFRFTLSEDITSAIPPGDERIYAMALDLAARFEPLLARDRERLLASARKFEPIFRA